MMEQRHSGGPAVFSASMRGEHGPDGTVLPAVPHSLLMAPPGCHIMLKQHSPDQTFQRDEEKVADNSEKQVHFLELFPFPFLGSLSFSDFEGFEDFVFFLIMASPSTESGSLSA